MSRRVSKGVQQLRSSPDSCTVLSTFTDPNDGSAAAPPKAPPLPGNFSEPVELAFTPPTGLYEGTQMSVRVWFPQTYPMEPFTALFTSQIFHPCLAEHQPLADDFTTANDGW